MSRRPPEEVAFKMPGTAVSGVSGRCDNKEKTGQTSRGESGDARFLVGFFARPFADLDVSTVRPESVSTSCEWRTRSSSATTTLPTSASAAGWGSAREGAGGDPRGVAASAGEGASGTQRPPPAEDAVRPMPVPDSHRTAVLEGLRRVLQLGHTRKDPAQYWEEKGRMPEFPFPEQLQAMREELGLG